MATPRQQSNSHFKRGSGLYTCRVCKHQTRNTGGDGADVQLCDLCYELAGEENHIIDHGGKTCASKENVTAELAALDKRNGAGTARRCFEEVCDAVGYDIPKATEPAAPRILTQAQAEAVYRAMCELNNVGAKLDVELPTTPGSKLKVIELHSGGMVVALFRPNSIRNEKECYADRNDLATAYCLAAQGY